MRLNVQKNLQKNILRQQTFGDFLAAQKAKKKVIEFRNNLRHQKEIKNLDNLKNQSKIMFNRLEIPEGDE